MAEVLEGTVYIGLMTSVTALSVLVAVGAFALIYIILGEITKGFRKK